MRQDSGILAIKHLVFPLFVGVVFFESGLSLSLVPATKLYKKSAAGKNENTSPKVLVGT